MRLCLGGSSLLGRCCSLRHGSLLCGGGLGRLCDATSLGLGEMGIGGLLSLLGLLGSSSLLGGGGLLLSRSLLLSGSGGSLLRSSLLCGSGLFSGSLLLGRRLLLNGSLLGGSGLLGGGLLGGSLLSSLLLGSRLLLSGRLLGLGLLLGELGATRRTLGLLEDALVNASLQGLVEERVEHVVRDIESVVCLDILLQGLTAGALSVLEVDNGISDHVLVAGVARLLRGGGLGRHGEGL